jgi:hypothetical protein
MSRKYNAFSCNKLFYQKTHIIILEHFFVCLNFLGFK